MKRYPLRLRPICREAIWGGKRLIEEWNKPSAMPTLAESWELSVRRDACSVIENGEARGMTLDAYLQACGEDAAHFPLLVKWIDAAEALSVQVHPDDDYAKRTADASGKNELWYIADADEDAYILYGLREGVDKAGVARALREGRAPEVLRRVRVRRGECYYIPSGTVHAIGAGVLIAEIQQNSDLTYRLYDYDRVDRDGKPRALHIDDALAVLCVRSDEEIDALRFERDPSATHERELLADCRDFSVRLLEVDGSRTIPHRENFLHLLCVAGQGEIAFDGESVPIARGESVLIPANMGECRVNGKLTLLCSQA